ncbi:hypothetical protein SASPL_113720 [Salvia splendens]|uniref:C2H2-type domain-containing protein n=1 Tax=Salvia splendens TaxID=180675 RepID=A0A8X9A0I8_SALSN|nr:transcriptional regulator SUPERMAN-like [Salvia splendens]KAG6423326.1 hypothetical protein SASPL_113720 [Salvia splendens]
MHRRKRTRTTTRRAWGYECTFCKRGFTNAQALGGHMNIHRKDKAKAKANHKNQSLDMWKENHLNSRFVSVNDHHQQMLRYQMCLPSSNPSFQIGNYLPFHRFREGGVENEVDLELRLGLGHDP